jgi:hypothetical protein
MALGSPGRPLFQCCVRKELQQILTNYQMVVLALLPKEARHTEAHSEADACGPFTQCSVSVGFRVQGDSITLIIDVFDSCGAWRYSHKPISSLSHSSPASSTAWCQLRKYFKILAACTYFFERRIQTCFLSEYD